MTVPLWLFLLFFPQIISHGNRALRGNPRLRVVRRTKEQPDAGCYRAVFGCYEMQSHERITYHQSQKPNFASWAIPYKSIFVNLASADMAPLRSGTWWHRLRLSLRDRRPGARS